MSNFFPITGSPITPATNGKSPTNAKLIAKPKYALHRAFTDHVKQQLRRLCTTGYDLGAILNRNRQRVLYDAARRYFGSWRGALRASGINLANVTARKPPHLNRETMVLWLRHRQLSGNTLNYSEVCLENRAYALAIRREFGSWAAALEEAGIEGDS